MLVGYARVSSVEQETTLQRDALNAAGVTVIYQEKKSSLVRRPLLECVLYTLRAGDVLVVYKIDRLARSLPDLLRILERLKMVGASFRSLTEPIDTTSPVGLLILQMLGAVAQFERSLIRERAMAGQIAAYRRGVRIGRPRALTLEQQDHVYHLWLTGDYTMTDLARSNGVHLSSIKRVILRHVKPQSPAVRLTMVQHVQS